MNGYRYKLEKYNGMATKHRCPQCDQNRRFTKYINNETNDYISDKVGRCDRSDNCGYHYTPKQYFADFGNLPDLLRRDNTQNYKTKIIQKPTSYIPFNIFQECLGKDLDKNNFVKYLISLFGIENTKKLIAQYYISTSNLWEGATVFWQIDINKNIRTGKIMQYNSITGKREKNKNHWVHSILKLYDFNLKQCFFGEHLLIEMNKVVAIVESDKTAVIMSHILPQYIWISCSGKDGLNENKFKVLKGRTVILFPDLSKPEVKVSCIEFWSKKADEFKNIANIKVSDYLEKIASIEEKNKGLDIADYYINHIK